MGTQGKATTSSYVRNVSNTGQMSTSSQKTGATGGVVNKTSIYSAPGANGAPGTSSTTTVRTQGDPGFQIGQESDVIKYFRQFFGL